jgi:hypothetical protein
LDANVDLVLCPRCGSGFREPIRSLARLEQEATKVTMFELCADDYRAVFRREPSEQVHPRKAQAGLAPLRPGSAKAASPRRGVVGPSINPG